MKILEHLIGFWDMDESSIQEASSMVPDSIRVWIASESILVLNTSVEGVEGEEFNTAAFIGSVSDVLHQLEEKYGQLDWRKVEMMHSPFDHSTIIATGHDKLENGQSHTGNLTMAITVPNDFKDLAATQVNHLLGLGNGGNNKLPQKQSAFARLFHPSPLE